MSVPTRKLTLEVAVVLTLLMLCYIRASQAFPFYYAWDMDWTTTLDALVIQSGDLPDHVNHTAFGMYLLLAWSHRLASALGHVSFLDLSDVAAAGNPLVGVAELADFFRAHTPVVLVTIVLAQLAGLAGVARLATGGERGARAVVASRPFLLLVLLLLGVQESAFYHAPLIRSELYSLLFWCLSFAAGVAALRARSRRTSALRFGLCGLLLALSWSTKLQSLLLVGWLVLLLVALRELGWSRSPIVGLEPARGRARFVPGLCLFAPAALLVQSAARFEVPQGMATFVESYPPNSAALLVLTAFAAPFLLAAVHRRSPALEALLAGALVAALLHLLVYADPRTGWSYLLVDTKMLLFRTNYQSLSLLDPIRLSRRLVAEWAGAPALFAVHGCVLALALRVPRTGRARALLVLLEFGLLCHIGLATRDIMRDAIWVRLPLVLWTLVLALSLLARPRAKPARLAGVLLLLALALLSQARQVVLLPSRLDTHLIEYNWTVWRWAQGVYSGEHRRYNALIAEKVDPAAPARWLQVAAAQARDWAQARRDLGHALVNQEESFRDVTSAAEGFALPHGAERLVAVSSDLRGGLIVRPSVWTPTGPRMDGPSVRALRQDPEARPVALTSPPAAPRLALLGRPDLDVVLFLPAGAPTPPGWTAGPEQLDVATAAGLARFNAFRADLYGEVETSLLRGGAFVLVKRRF